MTSSEIAQLRLANQQLPRTNITNAVQLVEWFCAVQAQEYAPTKWGLGLRLKQVTDTDIEKAFNAGKILRTHLLRPTWHFVSAKDIYWLLELTSARVNAANAYMYRKLELDNTVFKACIKILEKVLQGGQQLTRNAINTAYQKNNIIASGHRLSYIMMYAELAGVICSGARQGNEFTYALLNERVTTKSLLDKNEALAKLTGQYFASRGPATIKDFATWSGLTLTECKKGIEAVKDTLHHEILDGAMYYFSANIDPNKKAVDVSEDIYFLPIYDEFIMGYKDRSAITLFASSLKPKPLFQFDSMVVAGGQIIGTWRRTIVKKEMDMQVQFFRSLNKKQHQAFTTAIQQLEEFSNMKVNCVLQ